MFDWLKNNDFLKSNKIQGLHCLLLPEGDVCFYYTLLTRTKGKIEISKVGSFKGNIDQIDDTVLKNIPVFLSMDGKGVLSKKVKGDDAKTPLQQVIPNAVEDEFVVAETIGTADSLFISLARKENVEELIQAFCQQGFLIIGFSLGAFKAARLQGVFESLPTGFHVGNYWFECNETDKLLHDYRKIESSAESDQYTVGDQLISSEYIVSFYHALSYYLANEEAVELPSVSYQFEEYTSKRLFTIAGWGVLIVLFMMLMINMLLFTSYSDQKRLLETRVAGDKELVVKLNKLKEDLAWKEKFLSQAGILGYTKTSYYADQLAQSLPESVTLEKMEIHPVASKIKKQKEIELIPNKILIEGLANGSQLVNEWMEGLKQLDWIADVLLVNYSRNENAATGVFSLEIELKGR